jgi:hypothetical protein
MEKANFNFDPERIYSEKDLKEALDNLADQQSAGMWSLDRVNRVDNERSVYETEGMTPSYMMHEIQPINTLSKITFVAYKRLLRAQDVPYLDSAYILSTTVSQNIEIDEIPESVLLGIVAFDNEKDDESGSTMNRILTGEQIFDHLKDTVLNRTQQMTYVIDSNGEMEDYKIEVSYSSDGEKIHSMEYPEISDDDDTDEDDDGDELDAALEKLSEDIDNGENDPVEDLDSMPTIAEIISKYNSISKKDLQRLDDYSAMLDTERKFAEMIKEKGSVKVEHIQRLMAMVAMVANGFEDFGTE